jgi:DNA-directed RNA polymerase subunit RPC12/RpoP
MRRWVLNCAECDKEFTHTEKAEMQSPSSDPFTGRLPKPDFPDEGLQLECPHCKKRSLYKKSQLVLEQT